MNEILKPRCLTDLVILDIIFVESEGMIVLSKSAQIELDTFL